VLRQTKIGLANWPARLGAALLAAIIAGGLPLIAVSAAEQVPIPIPAPRAAPMPVPSPAPRDAQHQDDDPLGALLERLTVSSAPPPSQQPVVLDLRVGDEADRTRLVVELSDAVSVQLFTLTEPNRVVIDMPEVLWRNAGSRLPANNRLVQSYRYGLFREGNSRLVIDLKAPVRVSEPRILPPEGGHAFRLLLDLSPTSAEAFAAGAGWPEEFRNAAIGAPGGPQADQAVPALPAGDPSKRVIVLDPGHGGIDPGTHGPSGMLEKDVVLNVAKELRDALEATGLYTVYLTRDSDVFIPLRGRVDIARAAKADLFVSLHIDSHEHTDIRGASVYTLSEDASDREAARLADKENMSDVIAGVDLASEDSPVASILIDLAQRNTMNRSVRFAETVLVNLRQSTYVRPSTPHRSAGFAVLKAPDVPAVLIELGYITNHLDEREMATSAWRLRVSQSITAAIDAHFGAQGSPETARATPP